MTDNQAKRIAIAAAWRKAVYEPVFPEPHGSDNFDSIYASIHAYIQSHYEANAERILVEVLQRDMLKATRRKECLRIAVMTVALAAIIVLMFSKCVQ